MKVDIELNPPKEDVCFYEGVNNWCRFAVKNSGNMYAHCLLFQASIMRRKCLKCRELTKEVKK